MDSWYLKEAIYVDELVLFVDGFCKKKKVQFVIFDT